MRRAIGANDGERRFDPAKPKSKSKPDHASLQKIGAPLPQSDCACGGSCPKCREQAQALPMSKPSDASEREADAISARIVRGESAAGLVRATKSGTQIAPSTDKPGSVAAKRVSSSALRSSRSGGQALESHSRASMGMRFGADFGAVRIHADDESARMSKALNAKAFTVGEHIHFGAGRYQPESPEGERLLAHELTHVLQQGRSGYEEVQRDVEDESIEEAAQYDSGDDALDGEGDGFELETMEDEAGEMQSGRGRCRAERNFSFLIPRTRDFEFTVPRRCSAMLTFLARWQRVSTGEDMCCTGSDTYAVVRNGGRPQHFPAGANHCADGDPAPPRSGTMTVRGGRQRFRIIVDRSGCSGVALSVQVNVRIR